ncbi:hypothetical protein QJS04_geneDACA014433 [Acorus gramineus]|uniref:Uncharacterized protein n=1 Tax=Acorus gramineus TaxID=55184 RepID=A0AAV9BP49_ACOGR|nr:hypothetical protein QJS04_geneDACA014433 [Acorus gramineus]
MRNFTSASDHIHISDAIDSHKEMVGNDIIGRSRGTANAGKSSEQQTEKKKGFGDWINLMKPGNEEKNHWGNKDDLCPLNKLIDARKKMKPSKELIYYRVKYVTKAIKKNIKCVEGTKHGAINRNIFRSEAP